MEWNNNLTNLYPILFHVTSPDFRSNIEAHGLSNYNKAYLESYELTAFGSQNPHFLCIESSLKETCKMIGSTFDHNTELITIEFDSKSLLELEISEDKSFSRTPIKNDDVDYSEYVFRCIKETGYVAFLEDIPSNKIKKINTIPNPYRFAG
jgi:hypothetical protein